MTFYRLILLIGSLMTFMRGLHGSSCDEDCTDKPVFHPSKLVVRYGDQASAWCTACQHDCQSDQTHLEVPVGQKSKDGNIILWKVDNMTEWNPSATCYYSKDDGNRCCNHLPVTVYKLPEYVFLDLTGPMFNALECTVRDVAPAENLIVTFYKGQTALAQLRSNNTMKTPGTEIFTLEISNFEDDYEYWCEAKLELGPEGPPLPPVVTSPKFAMSSVTTLIHSFSLCFILLTLSLV